MDADDDDYNCHRDDDETMSHDHDDDGGCH